MRRLLLLLHAAVLASVFRGSEGDETCNLLQHCTCSATSSCRSSAGGCTSATEPTVTCAERYKPTLCETGTDCSRADVVIVMMTARLQPLRFWTESGPSRGGEMRLALATSTAATEFRPYRYTSRTYFTKELRDMRRDEQLSVVTPDKVRDAMRRALQLLHDNDSGRHKMVVLLVDGYASAEGLDQVDVVDPAVQRVVVVVSPQSHELQAAVRSVASQPHELNVIAAPENELRDVLRGLCPVQMSTRPPRATCDPVSVMVVLAVGRDGSLPLDAAGKVFDMLEQWAGLVRPKGMPVVVPMEENFNPRDGSVDPHELVADLRKARNDPWSTKSRNLRQMISRAASGDTVVIVVGDDPQQRYERQLEDVLRNGIQLVSVGLDGEDLRRARDILAQFDDASTVKKNVLWEKLSGMCKERFPSPQPELSRGPIRVLHGLCLSLVEAELECGTDPMCAWSEGECSASPCVTTCEEAACRTDQGCAWREDGVCLGNRSPALCGSLSQCACLSAPGCTWDKIVCRPVDVISEAEPTCAAQRFDECIGESRCEWDGEQSACVDSSCSAVCNPNACRASSGCTWLREHLVCAASGSVAGCAELDACQCAAEPACHSSRGSCTPGCTPTELLVVIDDSGTQARVFETVEALLRRYYAMPSGLFLRLHLASNRWSFSDADPQNSVTREQKQQRIENSLSDLRTQLSVDGPKQLNWNLFRRRDSGRQQHIAILLLDSELPGSEETPLYWDLIPVVLAGEEAEKVQKYAHANINRKYETPFAPKIHSATELAKALPSLCTFYEGFGVDLLRLQNGGCQGSSFYDCESRSNCRWLENEDQCDVSTCGGYCNEAECSSNVQCTWDTEKGCVEEKLCNTLDENKCRNSVRCLWNYDTAVCDPGCADTDLVLVLDSSSETVWQNSFLAQLRIITSHVPSLRIGVVEVSGSRTKLVTDLVGNPKTLISKMQANYATRLENPDGEGSRFAAAVDDAIGIFQRADGGAGRHRVMLIVAGDIVLDDSDELLDRRRRLHGLGVRVFSLLLHDKLPLGAPHGLSHLVSAPVRAHTHEMFPQERAIAQVLDNMCFGFGNGGYGLVPPACGKRRDMSRSECTEQPQCEWNVVNDRCIDSPCLAHPEAECASSSSCLWSGEACLPRRFDFGTQGADGSSTALAFDHDRETAYVPQRGASPVVVGYDFADEAVTIAEYTIISPNAASAPQDFELQGFANREWVFLDRRVGRTQAEASYRVPLPGAYTQYRLVITRGNTDRNGVQVRVSELELRRASAPEQLVAAVVAQDQSKMAEIRRALPESTVVVVPVEGLMSEWGPNSFVVTPNARNISVATLEPCDSTVALYRVNGREELPHTTMPEGGGVLVTVTVPEIARQGSVLALECDRQLQMVISVLPRSSNCDRIADNLCGSKRLHDRISYLQCLLDAYQECADVDMLPTSTESPTQPIHMRQPPPPPPHNGSKPVEPSREEHTTPVDRLARYLLHRGASPVEVQTVSGGTASHPKETYAVIATPGTFGLEHLRVLFVVEGKSSYEAFPVDYQVTGELGGGRVVISFSFTRAAEGLLILDTGAHPGWIEGLSVQRLLQLEPPNDDAQVDGLKSWELDLFTSSNWTVTGCLSYKNVHFHRGRVEPLVGVKVRISASNRRGTLTFTPWATVRTNKEGCFRISKTVYGPFHDAPHYLRLLVRFENRIVKVVRPRYWQHQVHQGYIPLHETQVHPGHWDIGHRILGDTRGGWSSQRDRHLRDTAFMYTIATTLQNYLYRRGPLLGFINQVIINFREDWMPWNRSLVTYPHWGTQIGYDFMPFASLVIRELMYHWHYNHMRDHGFGYFSHGASQEVVRSLLEEECLVASGIAFARGFAEYSKVVVLREVFDQSKEGGAMELKWLREHRTCRSKIGRGLFSPAMVSHNADGVEHGLFLLTDESFYRRDFTARRTHPGIAGATESLAPHCNWWDNVKVSFSDLLQAFVPSPWHDFFIDHKTGLDEFYDRVQRIRRVPEPWVEDRRTYWYHGVLDNPAETCRPGPDGVPRERYFTSAKNGGSPVSLAFDGDSSTVYQPGSDIRSPLHFGTHFLNSVPVSITGYSIEVAIPFVAAPNRWRLEGSADWGKTWVTLHSQDEISKSRWTAAGGKLTFSTTTGGQYRSCRIVITGAINSFTNPLVAELSLFLIA